MTAPRKPPISPVPGVTFHDLRPGDWVMVTISGRLGKIVRRCAQKRDGWIVAWDEPLYGIVSGRVAWANLEPYPSQEARDAVLAEARDSIAARDRRHLLAASRVRRFL